MNAFFTESFFMASVFINWIIYKKTNENSSKIFQYF